MKYTASFFLALFTIPFSSAQKVRGISHVDRPHRGLDEDGEKGEKVEKGGKESSKKGEKEKKGPSKRVCNTKFQKDKYEFKCKSKTDDGVTEIKDEINYSIKKTTRGVEVNIEYEQKIETTESEDTDSEDNAQTTVSEENVQTSDSEDNDAKNDSDTAVERVKVGEGNRRQQEEIETETSYEIVFDRLVEYVPSEGLMAYNFDNEVVQNISLFDWQDFTAVVGDSSGVTSTFSLSSKDGMVTFTFTVSRANQGESASANKMKIDFRLTDFPWARNDTYVALVSFVETEREVEVEYSDETEVADDVVIAFPGEESMGLIPFGELTWATTAEVTANNSTNLSVDNLTDLTADNSTDFTPDSSTNFNANNSTNLRADNSTTDGVITIVVVATSDDMDGGKSKEIAFSFVGSGAQGASDIFWDPEIGVNYAESPEIPGSSASPLSLGLAFMVMTSFTLLF